MSDLFTHSGTTAPLAVRMRPRSVDEFVGQGHLLRPGLPLQRLLEGSGDVSVILWGPPGTGKTTIATLAAQVSARRYVELSAITAGVKDVREVVERARAEREVHNRGTVLFLDEVHRFNKTQQDALLPAVENGWVTLIAATTENPSFSVNAPLLSRSVVLQLQSLQPDELASLVMRAVAAPYGLDGSVELDAEALEAIVRLAAGDARRALTTLEAASASAGSGRINAEMVQAAIQQALVRYDADGDEHYDTISAFIKSVRGSDVDAALHWLAKMTVAGEDPRFIARRLVILASEDIGMADPSSLQVATAAMHAVAQIGMPEAKLTLAQATIHLALAPKSNSVTRAIGAAEADIRAGRTGKVPSHLRDAHYKGAADYGVRGYVYPHDDPAGAVAQEYGPMGVPRPTYFEPTQHGAEARLTAVVEYLRALVRGAD
jgi:putative ATPase